MHHQKYEVGIYNEQVRAALADGLRHKNLKDEWADIHWIEVTAADDRLARQRIEQKYPPHAGYVITGVQLVNH